MSFDHDTFISPFSWRYGSPEMRQIWSETHKRRLMRRLWVALASAQHQAGLVTGEQLADLRSNVDNVDIDRALELEKETQHDVVAEIKSYAEQCPIGGAIIHWGATSADITDNVDVLRIREGVFLVEQRLKGLLEQFAQRIEATAELVVMAYTHIQPAEPTTLGYRFAVYAQDLQEDLLALQSLLSNLRGKGFKGAVGTQATFLELLQGTRMSPGEMEAQAMAALDLPYYPIATQTYTRQQDLRVLDVLAGIASSLHKFASDFRLLQSPQFGEWHEPFGEKQIGSSAMPFKRNPVNMENVCSLARYVAGLPAVAWDNSSQAVLERSLDDSANRRLFLAEAFLAVDEMLLRTSRVVAGMILDEKAMAANLGRFGPFAATERVLTSLVSAGADRQAAHEWIREASLKSWEAIGRGEANPLVDLLLADKRIGRYLQAGQLRNQMAVETYAGTAAARAKEFAVQLRQTIGVEEEKA